jgi:hypothetical protein
MNKEDKKIMATRSHETLCREHTLNNEEPEAEESKDAQRGDERECTESKKDEGKGAGSDGGDLGQDGVLLRVRLHLC